MANPMGGQRLVYSVTEAAQLLGVSPSTVYTMVRRKELPAAKVGYRVVIGAKALEFFVNSTALEVEGTSSALADAFKMMEAVFDGWVAALATDARQLSIEVEHLHYAIAAQTRAVERLTESVEALHDMPRADPAAPPVIEPDREPEDDEEDPATPVAGPLAERGIFKRRDVAAILGVAVSTVLYRERTGRYPPPKPGFKQGELVYSLSDIRRLQTIDDGEPKDGPVRKQLEARGWASKRIDELLASGGA